MKTFKKLKAWTSTLVVCFLTFSVTALAQDRPDQKQPKLTDPEIASIAVTANRIDVDYAAVANKKSKDAEVLKFAKTMHDDHTSVIAKAEALCKKLGVTPKNNAISTSLLDGAKKTKESLNSKSGSAFNKAYIENEVAYHKAVISTVEGRLIPEAQNKELKALLTSVLPVLKSHLGHAEMLMKEYK
jgi:putative membrane protein